MSVLKTEFLNEYKKFSNSSYGDRRLNKFLKTFKFLDISQTQLRHMKNKGKLVLHNFVFNYYDILVDTKYHNLHLNKTKACYLVKKHKKLDYDIEIEFYINMVDYYNNTLVPLLNEIQNDKNFDNFPITSYPVRFLKMNYNK